jgi:protein gp37
LAMARSGSSETSIIENSQPPAKRPRVRFLSCEPMLSPVTLDLSGINWVICDGESGRSAPMQAVWARSVRDQCAKAGVAFFQKQMSAVKRKMPPIPDDLMIRQFPNAA